MKARLLLLLFAGAVCCLLAAANPFAAPDPVSCTGYPEPRIQLENQSWWTPQPDIGGVGHIHVGMCAPIYQHLSGTTLRLDVTIKLHHMSGVPSKIRVGLYDDATWNSGITVPACSTDDCTYTYALDVPLSVARYSGWHDLAVFLNVTHSDGTVQRNWPRYPVYLDNGKPPMPFGAAGSSPHDLGGDAWYSTAPAGGSTGQYAQAVIARDDVPWNETTGALTSLSGTWTPTVRYEARQNFAYVDPALHAAPPSKGTVVYEQTTANTGYHTQQLTVDTTKLSNGLHRLVIGSGNVGTNGTNTGVLVIPFLVNNPPACQQ